MADKVDFYGKVATFPKNVQASKAYNFLENIKIPKKKLWYFIIEKDSVDGEELQMIKYNNRVGFDCKAFLENLKEYYEKDEVMSKYISELVIEGTDKFSIIKNIPNVEVNGSKMVKLITEDLIKLLYK